MAGRIEGIWIKRAAGGVMDHADEATLVQGGGIEGDTHFGRSRRQVTIIEKEVFDRVRAALPDASPEMRRANFMVSGVDLKGSLGRTLDLGGVPIRIDGETRPCERMDEQCEGLKDALDPDWGGGVHGVVLDDGSVRVGDAVTLG